MACAENDTRPLPPPPFFDPSCLRLRACAAPDHLPASRRPRSVFFSHLVFASRPPACAGPPSCLVVNLDVKDSQAEAALAAPQVIDSSSVRDAVYGSWRAPASPRVRAARHARSRSPTPLRGSSPGVPHACVTLSKCMRRGIAGAFRGFPMRRTVGSPAKRAAINMSSLRLSLSSLPDRPSAASSCGRVQALQLCEMLESVADDWESQARKKKRLSQLPLVLSAADYLPPRKADRSAVLHPVPFPNFVRSTTSWTAFRPLPEDDHYTLYAFIDDEV